MADRRDEPLRGEQAISWFVSHRRGGEHVIDAALTALHESFGPDAPLGFVAPLDPTTGRPGRLLIEIALPIDSNAAWQTMFAAQSRLVDQADELRTQMRIRNPFDRIAITLSGPPEDWNDVLATIEELG
jgi:hypothetical protein